MHSKSTALLLLVVLLATACSSQIPQVTPTTSAAARHPTDITVLATPEPASTTTPTEVPETRILTVLAAASLTESFLELGKLFEDQNAGVKVSFSFAGSQQLAQQLSQGADADVFASASQKYMDVAMQADRVREEESKVFVLNRLVVIYPKDNPAGLKELKDLAKPGLKLDLADKSVPVGQYSLDFLDKAVNDPGFDPQYKANVLKNVVSYEDNVRAVVAKVALGEVDAGIVYVTDITDKASPSVGEMYIPDSLNTAAKYLIAPTIDSKNANLANAFVELILSPEGQSILAKYGFIPAVKNTP